MVDQLHITNVNKFPGAYNILLTWNNDRRASSSEVDSVKQQGGRTVPNQKLKPPGNRSQLLTRANITQYDGKPLKPSTPYNFFLQNRGERNTLHGQTPVSTATNAVPTNTLFIEGNSDTPVENTFALSVPQGTMITLYAHTNQTIQKGPWQITDTLNLPAGAQVVVPAVSLIQSFLTPDQFEVFASIQPQQGSAFLVAYQFSPGSGPQKPLPVTSNGPIDQVSGTPALAQSDQGTFVLLVFRKGVIEHYTHPSNTVQGDWTLAHTLKPPADTKVIDIALTQSDGLGGFKTIVHVTTPQGDRLVGYEFTPGSSEDGGDGDDEDGHKDDGDDGHDSGGSWQGPFDLVTKDGRPIDHVTGSPSLIQSINGEQESFQLLAPINGVISYYTNSSQSIKDPWTFVQTLKQDGNNPTVAVSLIQARSLNLEAVARVSQPGNSDFMVSYEFNPATGWQGPFTLLGPDGKPIIAGIPFEIF